jgi:hypothetical protein
VGTTPSHPAQPDAGRGAVALHDCEPMRDPLTRTLLILTFVTGIVDRTGSGQLPAGRLEVHTFEIKGVAGTVNVVPSDSASFTVFAPQG